MWGMGKLSGRAVVSVIRPPANEDSPPDQSVKRSILFFNEHGMGKNETADPPYDWDPDNRSVPC